MEGVCEESESLEWVGAARVAPGPGSCSWPSCSSLAGSRGTWSAAAGLSALSVLSLSHSLSLPPSRSLAQARTQDRSTGALRARTHTPRRRRIRPSHVAKGGAAGCGAGEACTCSVLKGLTTARSTSRSSWPMISCTTCARRGRARERRSGQGEGASARAGPARNEPHRGESSPPARGAVNGSDPHHPSLPWRGRPSAPTLRSRPSHRGPLGRSPRTRP